MNDNTVYVIDARRYSRNGEIIEHNVHVYSSYQNVIFIYYRSIKFIYMQKRCRFLIETTSFLRHLELFLVILPYLTKNLQR